MHRYLDGSSCPAPYVAPSTLASYFPDSVYSYPAPAVPCYVLDSTAGTEVTTDLPNQIRNVKPGRPQRSRKKATWNPSTDIYDENTTNYGRDHGRIAGSEWSAQSSLSRSSNFLRQSAQIIPIPHLTHNTARIARSSRRRISSILAEREDSGRDYSVTHDRNSRGPPRTRKLEANKAPRRRDIYIPSEDTTIMTIHPGTIANRDRHGCPTSPNTGLDLVTVSDEEGSLVSALRKKKVTRKSQAIAPKRFPLHQTNPAQGVTFLEDIVGTGGGKENVPPGKVFESPVRPRSGLHVRFGASPLKDVTTGSPRARSAGIKRSASTSSSKSRAEGSRKRSGPRSNYSVSASNPLNNRTGEAISPLRKSYILQPGGPSPLRPTKSPPRALRRHFSTSASTPRVPPFVSKPLDQPEPYPIISEDLPQPELYEDQWLTYQELALSQLLNSIFTSPNKKPDSSQEDYGNLRKRLIGIYHESRVVLLHKRLTASLLYGALKTPKDLLHSSVRIKDDVGQRRKFLSLWVETYQLAALKAALESVIGREVTGVSRLSSCPTNSESSGRQGRSGKKAIENFLEKFLIKNEDAVKVKTGVGSITSIARANESHVDDFGTVSWSWRRTVLRSLMLVLILDKAKTSGVLSTCLFQSTSMYKSSSALLGALASMLFPSLGDVTRPLSHLDYRVDYIQYPLEEYNYHVENLATDLRDGVILTKLVGFLLHPPSTLTTASPTASLTNGSILTDDASLEKGDIWTLSRNLKYPCSGRAQKLRNVQIAMNALTQLGEKDVSTQIITKIKPEDIVDGHRERTVSFLWGLLGKYGLEILVDWKELGQEIGRFRNKWYSQQNIEEDDSDADDDEELSELENIERYHFLLKSWARSITRLHKIRVSNFTTSFADSKAYEAIVNEYIAYFAPKGNQTSLKKWTEASSLTFLGKLHAVGCSNSFINLFTSSSSTQGAHFIPSKDFTITTLTFLASRLIPPSRDHRAAQTIQRTYRARLARREVTKRITLMRIAAHCATVVRTRERVVSAAIVLQRAWRRVLEKRIDSLVKDVVALQAISRGWLIRRAIDICKNGKGSRHERIRGGW